MSTDIKISKPQLSKIIQLIGCLGKMLDTKMNNLCKKTLL